MVLLAVALVLALVTRAAAGVGVVDSAQQRPMPIYGNW
jgi:hypothetical protein